MKHKVLLLAFGSAMHGLHRAMATSKLDGELLIITYEKDLQQAKEEIAFAEHETYIPFTKMVEVPDVYYPNDRKQKQQFYKPHRNKMTKGRR